MKTFARLFLLMTITTTVELVLLLTVGKYIGIVPTIVIIVLTGFLGAALAGREGRRAWRRVVDSLRRGELPADPIVQALLVLVGGVLLMTPGFLTDLFGFSCLIPPSRAVLSRLVQRYLAKKIEGGSALFGEGKDRGEARTTARSGGRPSAQPELPQDHAQRRTINVTDQQ